MKISIIHPSRSRPQQAAATAKAWLSSAKDVLNIEYILSVDHDDPYVEKYKEMSNQVGLIAISDNHSAIEAINNAAKITTGDLLIQIAEDFNTPPFHWDAYLIDQLRDKSDYLVKTQDGIQRTLVTLPIMDRVYYERFGYIYHPAYQHMFSDQELTAVAHMTGHIIELPLRIPHNHYSTGKMPKDEVSVKADATMGSGSMIFAQRLGKLFDLEPNSIIKQYKDIVWH